MSAYQYQAVTRDPTAVIGRRTVAAVVDGLIVSIPSFLVFTSEFEYVEEGDTGVPLSDFCDAVQDRSDANVCVTAGDRAYFAEDPSPLGGLLGLGLSLLLLVVLQAITGLTPGKALLGIRTVGEDGRPPGFGKAIVRWLLLIIDSAPWCVPLVGFIVALTSTGHRRIGDMAAKTFVVSKADAGYPIAVPGLTPAYPAAPGYAGAPGAWGAASGAPGAPGVPGAPGSGDAWGVPPSGAGAPGSGDAWGAAPSEPPVYPSQPGAAAPSPSAWAPSPSPAPAPAEPAAPPSEAAPSELTGAEAVSAPADEPGATEYTPSPEPAPGPAPSEPAAEETTAEPAPSEPIEAGPPSEATEPTGQAAGPSPSEPTEPSDQGTGPAPSVSIDEGARVAEPAAGEPASSAAEPSPEPAPSESPATEQAAPAQTAAAETAATQSQGTYNPQWDAARGTYIVWEPGRGKWLGWDDNAKEWKPL